MARKILIVDDDKDILMILRFAFEGAGYDVTIAGNGAEALEKMRALNNPASGEPPIPVAILDIMMPGIDGLMLLKEMKKEFPDTLEIMLTAHLSMESAIRSLNEGAFSYLTKPVNIAEVKLVVSNAYEKYDLKLENKRLVEELRKWNKYSETIIRHIAYTVIATDTNGFIRKVNQATEKLLGYKESDLLGNKIESIFTEEFSKNAWPELVKKGTVKDSSVVFLAKGNKEIKVSFTGTILKDEEGQVIGFLGTVRE